MKNILGDNKKGSIFWAGFSLGLILALLSTWYVVGSLIKSHNSIFAAYAMVPTLLLFLAAITSYFRRKTGAIVYAGLFALFLASAIAQGPYLILYIIPAWLFMVSSLLFISLYEN